jgi:hypothetical protein
VRGALLLIGLGTLSGCTPPAEVVRPEDLRAVAAAGATTLVVAYSRSGHTARAARALAGALGADYQRLTGSGREGGTFFSTPSAEARVEVHPDRMDLQQYQTLILMTPIWYWKPTALINTFIDANDLRGKRVILLYTFEGGIRDGAVRRWRERVAARGGEVRDVVGIDRKKRPDEAAEARRIAGERRAAWGL